MRSADDYYDMYANQAEPSELVKMGIDEIERGIREINPNEEHAHEAAVAIFNLAQAKL